jgi:FkbH-like protein
MRQSAACKSLCRNSPRAAGTRCVSVDDRQDDGELLQSYLQLDASGRAPRFAQFQRTLHKLHKSGEAEAAMRWATSAVSPLLDYSSLMALRRFFSPTRSDEVRRKTAKRLAILGGPTTLQLRQLIELFLAGEGIAVEVYEADYGLFRQELLFDGSGLDDFGPDVILLATDARDVRLFPPIDASAADVARLADAELNAWEQLWERARARWNASLIQNNFAIPPHSIFGHLAARQPGSREHYLARLNQLLAAKAPESVLLHDLNSLAAEAGASNWFDPRYYYEFKMPCGPDCLPDYAYSVVALLRAHVGRSKKVLALDLDNTLWGGVVGDLGPGGIKLGQGSGEGEAFLAFQQFAKDLAHRGIILAVCSKNDADKAREPFEKRADMVLRLPDISAFVANWENKADNLRTIANQLAVNLDSLVFVDDNPAERALVRRFTPEVAVPDLPEDPAGYIAAVSRYRYFELTSFTQEDRSRSQFYADNARRETLKNDAPDLATFLRSLDMSMTVEPVTDLNIERATQLINKSNQFNLTTRRYSLAEIREKSTSPEWRTRTFSLRDQLGDNGLISVILLAKKGDDLVIETWVMSCRVLQRGVEQFTRNELVDLCRAENCDRLLGTFIPTAKNGMVSDLYGRLGFAQSSSDEGTTFWEFPVGDAVTALPHFIRREQPHG